MQGAPLKFGTVVSLRPSRLTYPWITTDEEAGEHRAIGERARPGIIDHFRHSVCLARPVIGSAQLARRGWLSIVRLMSHRLQRLQVALVGYKARGTSG